MFRFKGVKKTEAMARNLTASCRQIDSSSKHLSTLCDFRLVCRQYPYGPISYSSFSHGQISNNFAAYVPRTAEIHIMTAESPFSLDPNPSFLLLQSTFFKRRKAAEALPVSWRYPWCIPILLHSNTAQLFRFTIGRL